MGRGRNIITESGERLGASPAAQALMTDHICLCIAVDGLAVTLTWAHISVFRCCTGTSWRIAYWCFSILPFLLARSDPQASGFTALNFGHPRPLS